VWKRNTRAVNKWWCRNITAVEGNIFWNCRKSEVKILVPLPKSWSCRKVQSEFAAFVFT
jgi:hypothetical protein